MIICLVDNAKTLKRCAICGNYISYTLNKNKKFNATFCCKECATTEKGKKIQVQRFKEKNKINPMCRPEIKAKFKQSFIKKYGVDNPSRVKEVVEKRKQTCIEKFGVDNIFKCCDFIDASSEKKRKQMFYNMLETLSKRSIIPLFDANDVINVNRKDCLRFGFKCKNCEYEFFREFFNYHSIYCPACAKGGCSSKGEREVADFLMSLGFIVEIRNRTILDGLEVDIVLPEKKICVEFDGLYWHSSARGKDKDYHLKKSTACENKGYKLVHIFEDEWYQSPEIIKKTLKQVLGLEDFIIEGNIVEVDKRFWNINDFPDYELIKETQPNMFYTKNQERTTEYKEGYFKIWDCGTMFLRRRTTLNWSNE